MQEQQKEHLLMKTNSFVSTKQLQTQPYLLIPH